MISITLTDDCHLVHLTETPPPDGSVYACQREPKIDVFFHDDYYDYEEQMLGNTYGYFLNSDPTKLVAAFTVASSALVLDFLQSAKKNKINKSIPRIKQRRQYPALLICQLAVFDEFSASKLGDEMLQHIKDFAILVNNTVACRYLIVEAVNKPKVIEYYQRNGFNLLYSSEEQEILKSKRKLDDDGHLTTRQMLYDLMLYRDTEK